MGGCYNRDSPEPNASPDKVPHNEAAHLLSPTPSLSPRKPERKTTLPIALINLPKGDEEVSVETVSIPFKQLARKFDEKFIFVSDFYRGSAGFSFIAMHSQSKLLCLCRRIKRYVPGKDGKSSPINQEAILRCEIEALGKLNHPNVLQLYEVWQDITSLYAVSESLTEGSPVSYKQFMKEKTENLISTVVYKVLSGLSYCHNKGVSHGTLSLSSLVFFKCFNGTYDVKLTGFGSVRNRAEENLDYLPSPLLYAAPEALRGQATAKSDVWSLGVIMYYLLTSFLPFHQPSKRLLVAAVEEKELKFSALLWSRYSPEVRDLLSRMLERDPEIRWSPAECLNHPWFRNARKPLETAVKALTSTLYNLSAFRCGSKLQLAVLSFFVVNAMSQEENQLLTEVFHLINSNGDAEISVDELANALKLILEEEETVQQAEKIMETIDLDGNGSIVYSEFMVAACNLTLLLTDRNIRKVFRLFDADQNGKISLRELKVTIKTADSGDTWNLLMKKVDKNSDGSLNFDEFKKLILLAAGEQI